MWNFPRLRPCASLFISAAIVAAPVLAQDAAPAAKQPFNKVIGVVVTIDPDGKKLSVKEDSGKTSDVTLNESTTFMLVPPGEKDLRKASRIELKDIAAGDRVYARSRNVEGQDSSPATSVIVMSRKDVAQHQEKTRDEWQRRGVAGKVVAVDPATKTITISAAGGKSMAVQTDDQTQFRRYAPDSVKFADAKTSRFADIDIGNNLRVLGNKAADGASVHAEEVLSGSFRNIGGTVISVDPAANEIKVSDLVTKQPVTVKVNEDTNLRRLPAPMATMIAARLHGGAPGNPQPQTANRVDPKGQGGPDSHPGFNGPGPGASGAPQQPAAPASAGDAAPGAGHRPDINQILEHAPQMTLAGIKAGDALVISSTNGSDPSRVTAISVIGGVEPILAAAPPSSRGAGRGGNGASGGGWTLDMGMPE